MKHIYIYNVVSEIITSGYITLLTFTGKIGKVVGVRKNLMFPAGFEPATLRV